MAKQWGALTLALGLVFSGAAFANEGQKDKKIQQQSGQEEVLQPETEKQAGQDTMEVELEQQAGAETKVNLSDLKQDKVKQLQQKLQEQGFYQGEVDGLVGEKTKQAFFQYKQSKGHQVSLEIDDKIAQELELGNLSDIKQVRGEEKKLEKKSEPKDIETQKGLEKEEGAVTDPQSGMEQDPASTQQGEIGVGQEAEIETEQQSGQQQPGAEMPEVQPQRGMQSKTLNDLEKEQVRNIQMQLQQQGFYQGEVNGEVNPETTQALEQFKKTKNLGAGATIDQRTAQSLGIQLEQKQPVRGEEKEPQKGMEHEHPETEPQQGTESPDQGY